MNSDNLPVPARTVVYHKFTIQPRVKDPEW